MKLHHIALATPSPQALAEFYVEVLGFEIIEKPDKSSLWLALGEAILMLEPCVLPDPARPFLEKRKGLHLLAFCIEKSERQKYLKALQAAHIPIQHESIYTVYFFDPDGNRIALSHYPF